MLDFLIACHGFNMLGSNDTVVISTNTTVNDMVANAKRFEHNEKCMIYNIVCRDSGTQVTRYIFLSAASRNFKSNNFSSLFLNEVAPSHLESMIFQQSNEVIQ